MRRSARLLAKADGQRTLASEPRVPAPKSARVGRVTPQPRPTEAAGRHNATAAIVDHVFSNEDTFELICSFLGPWSYLHLACVSRSFAVDAWAYVLRILNRVPGCQERERNSVATISMSWPAKVQYVRRLAFSLGLNANGKDLAGTLKLLASTYPELKGLDLGPAQDEPSPSRRGGHVGHAPLEDGFSDSDEDRSLSIGDDRDDDELSGLSEDGDDDDVSDSDDGSEDER
jgi:hypothetical protein